MDAKPPDYNAIYFDTNELIAHGWPEVSVSLSNLLYVGQEWNILPFIPRPVLDELEAKWNRQLEDKASSLNSAKLEFERVARPVECKAGVNHTDLKELMQRYRDLTTQALNRFGITVIPYTGQSAEFFFERAKKYLMPFEKKGDEAMGGRTEECAENSA
jgi:hypothetical protein